RGVYHPLRRPLSVSARLEIVEQLLRERVAVPVVGTHDHIRPRDTFERPFTVSALLRNTYVNRCLRVADGSANGIPLRRDSIVVEDSWKATKEIVEKVKLTSYYRWLLRGLVDLYDLPSAELDEIAWKRLSVELARRYTDPDWQSTGLDRPRIQTVIGHPVAYAGRRARTTRDGVGDLPHVAWLDLRGSTTRVWRLCDPLLPGTRQGTRTHRPGAHGIGPPVGLQSVTIGPIAGGVP